MPPRFRFRNATFSPRWPKSYAALDHVRQKQCDRAIVALLKGEGSPGLRVHPILPSKHYSEARLNSGDRIVFRLEGNAILCEDVVDHDHIDRYAHPKP